MMIANSKLVKFVEKAKENCQGRLNLCIRHRGGIFLIEDRGYLYVMESDGKCVDLRNMKN